MRYQDIISFWFEEVELSQWWVKDDRFDQLINDRFIQIHRQASACELYTWRSCAEGRLAEIIVLDQFSRNIFRDTPQAFAQDSLALVLAQEAVRQRADKELEPRKRSFLYMPYMHSESADIHRVAVKLFSAEGMEFNLDFELRHKAIIDRFERYPHRNKILGRTSTEQELVFLQTEGSSF